MTQPIATAPLSGPPPRRTGTLALPAPRPTYTVEVRQLPGERAELRAWNGTLVEGPIVLMVCAEPDGDGVPQRFFFGTGYLDGYEWGFRAPLDMTRIEVHDELIQRRPVTLAAE